MDELPPITRFIHGPRFHHAAASQVDIAASPTRVWEVLVDFARYPEWNPLTYEVETQVAEGARVTMWVRLPGKRPRTEVTTMHAIVPGRRICWGMVMGRPSLLNTNRIQLLTPTAGGGTRYFTEDSFSGWLVPVVKGLYGPAIQAGFEAMTAALKARCEAG